VADFPQKPPTSINDLLGEPNESPRSGGDTAVSAFANSIPSKSSDTSGMSLDDLLGGNVPKIQNSTPSELPQSYSSLPKNSFTQAFQKEVVRDEKSLLEGLESAMPQKDGNFASFDIAEDEPDEEDLEDPQITEAKKLLKDREEAFLNIKKMLILSQSFLVLFVLLALGGFLLFSVLLDEEGFFSTWYPGNFGVRLVSLQGEKTMVQKDITDAKKRMQDIEKRVHDLANNDLVNSVISERTDWFEAIKRIEEIDNSISVSEDTFVFENYSTKKGSNEIVIQGVVNDTTGHVFYQISKLLDAINKSKYFSGAKLQNYAKQESSEYGYTSTFNFTLLYYKDGKNADKKDKKDGKDAKTAKDGTLEKTATDAVKTPTETPKP